MFFFVCLVIFALIMLLAAETQPKTLYRIPQGGVYVQHLLFSEVWQHHGSYWYVRVACRIWTFEWGLWHAVHYHAHVQTFQSSIWKNAMPQGTDTDNRKIQLNVGKMKSTKNDKIWWFWFFMKLENLVFGSNFEVFIFVQILISPGKASLNLDKNDDETLLQKQKFRPSQKIEIIQFCQFWLIWIFVFPTFVCNASRMLLHGRQLLLKRWNPN